MACYVARTRHRERIATKASACTTSTVTLVGAIAQSMPHAEGRPTLGPKQLAGEPLEHALCDGAGNPVLLDDLPSSAFLRRLVASVTT